MMVMKMNDYEISDERMEKIYEKISMKMNSSWYDKGHIKEMKDWIIDQTLDLTDTDATLDMIDNKIDCALYEIDKKIKAFAQIARQDLIKEIKGWLDDIKAECEDEEEDDEDGD